MPPKKKAKADENVSDEMETDEVCATLRTSGLEEDIVSILKEQKIDGKAFEKLTDAVLKEMGVTAFGDRVRILSLQSHSYSHAGILLTCNHHFRGPLHNWRPIQPREKMARLLTILMIDVLVNSFENTMFLVTILVKMDVGCKEIMEGHKWVPFRFHYPGEGIESSPPTPRLYFKTGGARNLTKPRENPLKSHHGEFPKPGSPLFCIPGFPPYFAKSRAK